MTKENFTSINVVIDASGSMAHISHDTIGGFNSFLEEQKKEPGEAVVSLCTFSTDYRLVHNFVKLGSVPSLDARSYTPRGGTALLDAVGTTIDTVGAKLAAMPEEERPSKVIFLVITDGFENASRRYTQPQIKQMVEHQKEKYNWEFVFLGANVDAFAEGTSLGIAATNSVGYTSSAAGTRGLYSNLSDNMKSYRASNTSRDDNFFKSKLIDPANQTQQGIGGVTPVVPGTTTTTTTTTVTTKK